MSNFYKTPIILTTEILNDGFEVHFFDSDIMPAEEMEGYYFQNRMVQHEKPIKFSELIFGKYTLALSVADTYQFYKEWSERVELPENFSIDLWFEDYLDSKIELLENTECTGYHHYLEAIGLQILEDAKDTKSYLTEGKSRIDWTGFEKAGKKPREYTWEVEEYFNLMTDEKDMSEVWERGLGSAIFKNRGACDMLMRNLTSMTCTDDYKVDPIFDFINVFDMQDGRAPNFKYIQRCIALCGDRASAR